MNAHSSTLYFCICPQKVPTWLCKDGKRDPEQNCFKAGTQHNTNQRHSSMWAFTFTSGRNVTCIRLLALQEVELLYMTLNINFTQSLSFISPPRSPPHHVSLLFYLYRELEIRLWKTIPIQSLLEG